MPATRDNPNTAAVIAYLHALQDTICAALQALESAAQFREDAWTHADGGGGRTRIIADGEVFEKGGVNFSRIRGDALPAAATGGARNRNHLAGRAFEAAGVSVVMHPQNPFVPAAHLNVRYFSAGDDWWFGGGYDLTPCYAFADDCRHWHRAAKDACDAFGESHYARCKKACDEYFYLPHRGETRGVGGLFFDDFREGGFARAFAFMQSVGSSFLPAYLPIVERRRGLPYNESHRAFQAIRRGRYAEFNLVYDRGTLFGLQSGGRVESILMSLPPRVEWRYDYRAAAGGEEAALAEYLQPRDWLGVAEKC